MRDNLCEVLSLVSPYTMYSSNVNHDARNAD